MRDGKSKPGGRITTNSDRLPPVEFARTHLGLVPLEGEESVVRISTDIVLVAELAEEAVTA